MLKFTGTEDVKAFKSEIVTIGQSLILAMTAIYLACIAAAFVEANK